MRLRPSSGSSAADFGSSAVAGPPCSWCQPPGVGRGARREPHAHFVGSDDVTLIGKQGSSGRLFRECCLRQQTLGLGKEDLAVRGQATPARRSVHQAGAEPRFEASQAATGNLRRQTELSSGAREVTARSGSNERGDFIKVPRQPISSLVDKLVFLHSPDCRQLEESRNPTRDFKDFLTRRA